MLVDISNTSKFTFNNDEVRSLLSSAILYPYLPLLLQADYPLILQAQRKEHDGCAVVSPSQFTENFNKFTENQFKGMNWDNVFVAGGGVLGMHLSLFSSLIFTFLIFFIIISFHVAT